MDPLWRNHGGACGLPRAAAILHRRGGSLGGDCQIRRPKAGKSGAGTGTALDRSRLPFALGIQRRGHRRRLHAASGRPAHRLGEVPERDALSGAAAGATGISRLAPTGVDSPYSLAAAERADHVTALPCLPAPLPKFLAPKSVSPDATVTMPWEISFAIASCSLKPHCSMTDNRSWR